MGSPAQLELLQGASELDVLLALGKSETVTPVDLLDLLPWTAGAADWTAWRAFLAAAYGLPMTDREYEIYRVSTGRTDRPTERATEVVVPTGRRARKSAVAAIMAVHAAAFRDHAAYLAPGERAIVPVMAKSKEDAITIRRYCGAIMTGPLAQLILDVDPETGQEGKSTERLSLRTGCDIEVKAARMTSVRGRTCPLFVGDEVAFWPALENKAAEPDEEILRSVEPAQMLVPGAMTVLLSSPYARRGILWRRYREHYGRAGRVLVWQAPTIRMHDTPQSRAWVLKQHERDPASAKAEVGAADGSTGPDFRTDVEALLPLETVEACVAKGVTERAPEIQRWRHIAFVDPSGGRADAFTLSIGHWDPRRGKAVQDCLRRWDAPFEPHVVVQEACDELRRYDLKYVVGDRYAGEWPADRFREGAHAPSCARRTDEAAPCDCAAVWKVQYVASEAPKSDIYREVVPAFTDGRLDLLDDPRMVAEFVGLDRRTSRGGYDSIDHRAGAHDDAANATAGMAVRILRERPLPKTVEPVLTLEQAHVSRLHEAMRRRAAEKNRPSRGGKGAPGL